MNKNKDSVRIIPLGGLERIGVNITAIEYDDEIIVIDCGLGFPEDDMFGIDLVIPDVTCLARWFTFEPQCWRIELLSLQG